MLYRHGAQARSLLKNALPHASPTGAASGPHGAAPSHKLTNSTPGPGSRPLHRAGLPSTPPPPVPADGKKGLVLPLAMALLSGERAVSNSCLRQSISQCGAWHPQAICSWGTGHFKNGQFTFLTKVAPIL